MTNPSRAALPPVAYPRGITNARDLDVRRLNGFFKNFLKTIDKSIKVWYNSIIEKGTNPNKWRLHTYVIYTEFGRWYITTEENFKAPIRNAHARLRLYDVETAEDAFKCAVMNGFPKENIRIDGLKKTD